MSDFIREEEKSEYQVRLNDTLSLRSGNLVITPTNFFSKAWTNVPIKVRKQPLDGVAARYQGNLGIRQEEDESSILTLSLKDNSPKRAEDILNTLINVYNEEAIKDKNQVAINTANFINDLYDFMRGTDHASRLGPKRACAQGWITPRAMQNGILLTLAVAGVAGCIIVGLGGTRGAWC